MFEAATQTFAYSETSITRGKQRMVALLLALVILVAAFFTETAGGGAFMLGVIVFVVVPLGYLQHRWIEENVRRMHLQLRHDGVVRQSGAIRQMLAWSDITHVVLRQSPRGEVHTIELFAVKHRPMVLAGYEHMADISRRIEAQLPPLVAVERKRSQVDLEKPGVVFACALVFGSAVLAGLTTWDWNYQLVNGACQLGMGLMFLLKQPLSRQNPNFRTREVVLTAGMLGLGLLSLLAAL